MWNLKCNENCSRAKMITSDVIGPSLNSSVFRKKLIWQNADQYQPSYYGGMGLPPGFFVAADTWHQLTRDVISWRVTSLTRLTMKGAMMEPIRPAAEGHADAAVPQVRGEQLRTVDEDDGERRRGAIFAEDGHSHRDDLHGGCRQKLFVAYWYAKKTIAYLRVAIPTHTIL